MKALNVTECVQFTPNLLLRKDSKHSRKSSNSQNTAKKLFEIPTQTQKTKTTSVQGSYLPSAIHKMLQTEFSWEMRLSLIISAQWCKTNIQNICYSLKHFMLCSQELCKNKNRTVASITQVCTVHRDTRQNAKYTSSVNFNSARNWLLSSAWPGCLPHWSASSPAVLPEPAISAYFFCSHPAKGNSPWTRELEPKERKRKQTSGRTPGDKACHKGPRPTLSSWACPLLGSAQVVWTHRSFTSESS